MLTPGNFLPSFLAAEFALPPASLTPQPRSASAGSPTTRAAITRNTTLPSILRFLGEEAQGRLCQW